MSIFRRTASNSPPKNQRRNSGGNDRAKDAADSATASGSRSLKRSFSRKGNARHRSAETVETDTRESSVSPEGGNSRLAAIARTALLLVMVALILSAGYFGWHHATTSSYFALQFIDIQGNSRLSNADVVSGSGILMGTNIFSIDLERANSNLRAQPWVLDARISQKLPRSVAIEVVERHAVALVLFEVPYLVDDKGEIFKRWTPGDPLATPIITGISREELTTDPESVTAALLDAIALADNYRQQGLETRAPLSEIFREVDGGFSLTVGTEAFYIKLGQGPYREKLTRVARLLDRLKNDKNRPSVIYSDNPNRPGRLTVKLKTPQNSAGPAEKKKPKI